MSSGSGNANCVEEGRFDDSPRRRCRYVPDRAGGRQPGHPAPGVHPLGGASADAWAGDAGVAIAVFDIMALGASVQNIGGDRSGGARLPRRTRAGFTMNYVDPQGTFRLLTTLEGQWPEGHAAVLVAGLEAGVVARGVGIVARVGATGHSAPSDASPTTVGGGVELGRLHVDYAYQGYDTPDAGGPPFGGGWTP